MEDKIENLLIIALNALIKTLDNDCDVNNKKDLENNNFDKLKKILNTGTYNSDAYDYYNKKKGSGMVKIIHNNNNTIDLEHVLNTHPEMASDKKHLEHNHQLKRTGTITLDNYNKIYYDQQTQCAIYMEGISSQAKYAVKHMELNSLSEFEAVFIGYGSSHSSKTYHASPDIKKIIKKDENSDSFSVKTYLDEELAYSCSYTKIQNA